MTIYGWILKPKVELRNVEDYARATRELIDDLLDKGFTSAQMLELFELAPKDLAFRDHVRRWRDKDPND